jgi:hypothetical protein
MEVVPPVLPNIDPSLVTQRRKLNAVYEKRLTEKNNFKNYKMGLQIDAKPKTCGDKRVGTFGNYSI